MRLFSRKQQQQQALYIALGTVIGFRGYLKNLQTVLHRAGYYKSDSIEHMLSMMTYYEQMIRRDMGNI